MNYKNNSKPPKVLIRFSPISDLPYSSRDLSFSIKDSSSRKKLLRIYIRIENKLLKEKFIFDYFYNKKNAEIKIGFRFIFQSADSTITETQVSNIIML